MSIQNLLTHILSVCQYLILSQVCQCYEVREQKTTCQFSEQLLRISPCFISVNWWFSMCCSCQCVISLCPFSSQLMITPHVVCVIASCPFSSQLLAQWEWERVWREHWVRAGTVHPRTQRRADLHTHTVCIFCDVIICYYAIQKRVWERAYKSHLSVCLSNICLSVYNETSLWRTLHLHCFDQPILHVRWCV